MKSKILINNIIWIGSLLFLMIVLESCSTKSKNELLIGKWKLTSITDLDKNSTQNFQSDKMVFLKITQDSIFQFENTFRDIPDKCGWKIKNDSIYLTSNDYAFMCYKIIRLNENELEVENKMRLKYSNGKEALKSNKIERYERLN